jgi:hypothetical protein
MTSLVNVIPTAGSYSASTAGAQLVWSASGGLTNCAGSNTICPTSQILELDGYSSASGTVSQSANCSFFKAIINFTISNPLYTDDETDVINMYVILPTSDGSYNYSQTFNIQCMLSNLGSTVSSPIYQLTSSTNSSGASALQIPFNKWFSFRAPGSTYQAVVEGFTIQSTVSCVTAQIYPSTPSC